MQLVNCQIQLTPAEILDLKAVTGKTAIKDAITDAVEYRIMHARRKKEPSGEVN